jgi:hypothetical protein
MLSKQLDDRRGSSVKVDCGRWITLQQEAQRIQDLPLGLRRESDAHRLLQDEQGFGRRQDGLRVTTLTHADLSIATHQGAQDLVFVMHAVKGLGAQEHGRRSPALRDDGRLVRVSDPLDDTSRVLAQV